MTDEAATGPGSRRRRPGPLPVYLPMLALGGVFFRCAVHDAGAVRSRTRICRAPRAAVAGSQERRARTDAAGPGSPVFMATEVISPFWVSCSIARSAGVPPISPATARTRSTRLRLQRGAARPAAVERLGGRRSARWLGRSDLPAYGRRGARRGAPACARVHGEGILLALAGPARIQAAPAVDERLSYFLALRRRVRRRRQPGRVRRHRLQARREHAKVYFPFFPRS